MSIIGNFITKVQATFKTGAATEHSYRSALEALFNNLSPGTTAINEPKRVACGAPDFLIQRGAIVIGHVEAKDLLVDIRTMKDANKKQQDRYRAALPNLIYTNCLDWDFYRNGERIASVTIADYLLGIQPQPGQYVKLENLLKDFISQAPQTITSPRSLAVIMAAKASLIKDVLYNALKADVDGETDLMIQFHAFREHLIHDITLEEFSDIYAETISYGMFAARLHDTTIDGFGRQEALTLLPKSNPFLRSLFGYIAGHDLDNRIAWIIDDLAAVFQATNIASVMEGFGKFSGRKDPFLHFYETFLAAYNPNKRKARGVWYTPEPVVSYIVCAVDNILKKEFGLSDGLSDTSKVTIDWDTGQTDKKGKRLIAKKNVHRVQILDPATGTGTFLAEVVKQISMQVKDVAPSMWSQYIETELVPRLHGFELLMASYTMCHTKLDMVLTELGYKPSSNPPRLSVYLTNSLEEGEPANQTLPFAQWLSNEAKQANAIKRDLPIMCVIGNPPYNPSSKNNNPWISEKMAAYKKGINDRKVNLSDDYMKFLRLAEDLIERNGSGVVAMITNNSFLDGTSQRGMRKHLLNTFNKIDVLNLHGDIRSQHDDPTDENVFDITQGVAISLMRKLPKNSTKCKLRYAEITGKREYKYEHLLKSSDLNATYQEILPVEPYYFFKPRDLSNANSDFLLSDLFLIKSSGIQTKNDEVAISWTAEERDAIVQDFQTKSIAELRVKYPPMRVWDTEKAQQEILTGEFERRTITYRPFDVRHTILTKRSGGFIGRPRYEVMQHIGEGDISLLVNKKIVGDNFSHVSVASSLAAHGVHYLGNRGQDYVCPLYLSGNEVEAERLVNFNPKLFEKFTSLAISDIYGEPNELNVFDYIYGVLHSPDYRKEYSEILKVDFPRIPWPESAEEFWGISAKGASLRRLHLMEPSAIGSAPYPFKGDGDLIVANIRYKEGKIWINKTQFFDGVPENAWHMCIGGYQPAQKWLKDRKDRKLSFGDIKHYQKIIKILIETEKIMATIEMSFSS